MSQIEELRKEDGKWKTIVDIITNPKVEIKDEQEGTEITEGGNRLKEWSEAKKSSRRRPIGE